MVTFHTNHGDIVIKTFDDKAPETVKNFLDYCREGFYNNTIFHRVINGFMIQGGGFEPGMRQKETKEAIKNEANNGLKNTRGTLAMAMNCKQLGKHFDIHGGGSDLMFPHHENEIAQSTCAHGGEYVNYWMHSGMVMVDREKMSKSLGNFFTVRDVLKYYDAETVRYFLMSGHYRSQLNYSEENLKQARSALERLYTALRGTDKSVEAAGGEAFEARFVEVMNDDFNTPEAYSVLFDMAREVNRLKSEDMAAANALASHLRKLSSVLGLLEQEPDAFLQSGAQADDGEVAEIEALINARLEARQAKDWAAADAARNRLTEMGIILEDGPQGTTWRRK